MVLWPGFVYSFSAIYLSAYGYAKVLYGLSVVWAVDTGAYGSGKLWGKRKCIPAVSPGKTGAGLLGGIVAGMVIAGFGYIYFHPIRVFQFFIWSFCVIIAAIFGDLCISMMKRRSHIKDTGHIFPGHGGVLDRVDSLIFAFPLWYIGIVVMHVI